MDEIDKKIEEIKENLDWSSFSSDEICFSREDVDWLIDRLKECREENNKENHLFSDIDEALAIQRTKETLKKALYGKITKVPVTDFQYVAWRDIERVFNEAKVDRHED